MKIALASDLHLEFADITLTNDHNAEVLILSGDIMVAQDLHDHPEPDTPYPIEIIKTLGSRQLCAQRFRTFLKRCSTEFSYVVYVAGNHEFFHGKFPGSLQDLRNECAKFPNIYFLENETKVIGDCTFIGCTLWTDMNKEDPLTQHGIVDIMNDYKVIRNDQYGYIKLRPAHTVAAHLASKKFISDSVTEKKDKFVVVGHHAPSYASVHPNFRRNIIANGAYASDLSEFILDYPQIKLWTHGHMHDPCDYTIGSTRIVCNPRGYLGHENNADKFELKYIDI